MPYDADSTNVLRNDVKTGRSWLATDGKPTPDEIAALKRAGWRWSGYRQEWNHASPYADPPIPYSKGELVDYASERAGRLQDAAASAAARSNAAYGKTQRIADGIPLGQPILVGHHSEGRHRADIARIDRGMRVSVDEANRAKRLNDAANASARHQQRMQGIGMCERRLERAETELRRWKNRNVAAITKHPEWYQQTLSRLGNAVDRAARMLNDAKAVKESANG